MPDGWKYDLELETGGFVQPAKDAAREAEKAGAKIEAAMNKAGDAAKAGGTGALDLKDKLSETGTAAEEVRDKLKAAGAEAEKSGHSLTKAWSGKQALLGGLAGAATGMANDLKALIPVSENVANGVGNVVQSAAVGFAAGGPWGAAIGGGIAMLGELGKAIFSTGEEEKKAAEASAEARALQNEVIAEHIRLVKLAGEEGAKAAQAALRGSWIARDQDRREDSELSSRHRMQDLELEGKGIAAAGKTGADKVNSDAALARERVKLRYDQEQEMLALEAQRSQEKHGSLDSQKKAAQARLAELPGNAKFDEERESLKAEIASLTDGLKGVGEEAAAARERLADFKKSRPALEGAEMRNIEGRRASEIGRMDAAQEKANADRDMRAKWDRKEWNADQRKEEAAKKQAEADKKRAELKSQIGDSLAMIEGADTPRRGREGTAEGRKIYGVVSRNTMGPRQVSDRMRDRMRATGDLLQRARKIAGDDKSPATEQEIRLLSEIARTLKQLERKPETRKQ